MLPSARAIATGRRSHSSFLRVHPNPSWSIDEAEIEFLKKLLDEQPDAITAWKIPCNLARLNRTKALGFLLERGVDVDLRERDSVGFTPLMYAVEYGEIGTVRFLLDHGANVNCPVDLTSPVYQETPLHAAALHGNTATCRWLLEQGADLHHRLADRIGVQSGWLPLHSAAWNGSVEVVRLLMEKGASPTEPCHEAGQGRTPFHLAVLKGNLPVVRLMVDRAAGAGRDKLDNLLAQPDAGGNTALHLAASREAEPNAGIVRLLTASGAPVDASNRIGQTPRRLCHDPESGSRDPAVKEAFGK